MLNSNQTLNHPNQIDLAAQTEYRYLGESVDENAMSFKGGQS